MSQYDTEKPRHHRRRNTNLWVAIGAVILIILLIIWLTVADFTGNTDVAAMVPPEL